MVQYAEDLFHTIESKQDDCRPWGQGVDGYGRKICTRYLVRLNQRGPWRRVYCCCFSNNSTLYVLVKREWVCFHQDENLRITGEWPKVA